MIIGATLQLFIPLQFADMNMSIFSPLGFKRKICRYWTYVLFSRGQPSYCQLWMDEILHRLRTPWNDDSSVNTNEHWFPMVLEWIRISSIHSFTPDLPWGVVVFCRQVLHALLSEAEASEGQTHVFHPGSSLGLLLKQVFKPEWDDFPFK